MGHVPNLEYLAISKRYKIGSSLHQNVFNADRVHVVLLSKLGVIEGSFGLSLEIEGLFRIGLGHFYS